jgi:hypothetical protein
MKLSFDFDGTLNCSFIQEYVSSLTDVEILICTSRLETDDNSDLFEISDKLNIKRSNIIFTNGDDKYLYLKDKNILAHVDDCNLTLDLIKKYGDIKPIYLFGNRNWKQQLNKLIEDEGNITKEN